MSSSYSCWHVLCWLNCIRRTEFVLFCIVINRSRVNRCFPSTLHWLFRSRPTPNPPVWCSFFLPSTVLKVASFHWQIFSWVGPQRFMFPVSILSAPANRVSTTIAMHICRFLLAFRLFSRPSQVRRRRSCCHHMLPTVIRARVFLARCPSRTMLGQTKVQVRQFPKPPSILLLFYSVKTHYGWCWRFYFRLMKPNWLLIPRAFSKLESVNNTIRIDFMSSALYRMQVSAVRL